VFSRNDQPNAASLPTPAILQSFLVRNDAPSELPLGELRLRYFFSRDQVAEQRARCDESRASDPNGCEGVAMTLGEVSMPFVDTYVEVRLPAGTGLGAGADSREIPLAVEPTTGALYDQANDQSFADNPDFVANPNVALYRSGVLIWGDEP